MSEVGIGFVVLIVGVLAFLFFSKKKPVTVEVKLFPPIDEHVEQVLPVNKKRPVKGQIIP